MDRSRSPRPDRQWIARQVAMFGRYPEKCPKDLRVSFDGAMYLADLANTWGKEHGIRDDEIITALRQFAVRGDEGSRFTFTSTVGGGTLIKVSPKNTQSGPSQRPRYRLPSPQKQRPRRPEERPNRRDGPKRYFDKEMGAQCRNGPKRDFKSKLDMSLDEVIWEHGDDTRTSGREKWRSRNDHGHKHSEEMTIDEARRTLGAEKSTAATTIHGKEASVPDDERSMRVRKKFEQMGLTPDTSHIRLKAGSKSLKSPAEGIETVDSSPSPEREEARLAEDDEVDNALAACAAKSLKVSGDVEVSGITDTKENEAPPRPPGGNWQQYFDEDASNMWWYWPGPGGEWWCGPNEGDEPKPYSETGME